MPNTNCIFISLCSTLYAAVGTRVLGTAAELLCKEQTLCNHSMYQECSSPEEPGGCRPQPHFFPSSRCTPATPFADADVNENATTYSYTVGIACPQLSPTL